MSLRLQKEKREERMIQDNSQNLNDLERARRLRREAELLENKERVRSRLRQLMDLSRDPDYDRYLAQMMKDLESGRATPWQVEQEAARSYRQYRERMARSERPASQEMRHISSQEQPVSRKTQNIPFPAVPKQPDFSAACADPRKSSIEFKVGIHVFSVMGALFVLAAFVILGYNFLEGLGQGICLYGIALIMVLLSELLFRKKADGRVHDRIRSITTGIGIGGLYVANAVNYQVLGVINGVEAMIITLLIASVAIFISKKRDSALIRIISLLGAYLSFLPMRRFDSELNFMIIAVILFIINTVSVFFRNQRRQNVVNIVHILLNLIFTALLTGTAWKEQINAVYLVFYVMTSFVFISIMSLKDSKKEGGLFPLYRFGNSFHVCLLFLIGIFGPGIADNSDMALVVHLITEALMAAVCLVVFLLWDREDGRRWAQLYYAAETVLALSSYYLISREFMAGSGDEYKWPFVLSVLAVLFLVKCMAGHREVRWLDVTAVLWTALAGCFLSEDPCCWVLAGALFLAAFRIQWFYMFHQLVITAAILVISWRQCYTFFYNRPGMMVGWRYPLGAVILLLMFLVFNHLPVLKNKKQQPYNIITLVFMGIYCFGAWTCRSYLFSSVMMVLGAVMILIVFRERYEMQVPRKYLILAAFLILSVLTGHYETPVIVSILLMIIALGCVGIGFKLRDKTERICGLVLAMFVCLKLVLYDFREVGTAYRVGVFLVVGVIALIISCIYMRLERSVEISGKEKAISNGESGADLD